VLIFFLSVQNNRLAGDAISIRQNIRDYFRLGAQGHFLASLTTIWEDWMRQYDETFV